MKTVGIVMMMIGSYMIGYGIYSLMQNDDHYINHQHISHSTFDELVKLNLPNDTLTVKYK